jgi:para-aminobenzoate synthetase component I
MPRLVRSSIGRWVDPAAAFTTLFGAQTDVVWLDSGAGATSGRSYVGQASRVVTSATDGSLLEFLRADLAAGRLDAETDGFALGWVGWLGYETRFETMDVVRTRTSPYPDGAVAYLDRAIEFDHGTGEVALLSLGEDEEWRRAVAEALAGAPSAPSDAQHRAAPALREGSRRVTWRDTDDEYLAKIRACQAAIAAGDAYLLCLTTQARVDATPDPVATYLALRTSSPSHHGALLRFGEFALLSSSPEQFLSVTPAGAIESRPIKGTRARGATPEEDAANAAELVASEKERAENLMIVDLMRNDIGRVSRIGSVEVPRLLAVESYAQVHQLVSTVRGQLEDGLDPMDAVVACFPAGSMTGTPKSSATRILDSLEGAARGIYSGAFGYFGLNGRIDLAMVIRSIVIAPDGATIGTGGGITALSDPEEELAEVKLKAAALLAVLGAH